jgi:hypothetical protein
MAAEWLATLQLPELLIRSGPDYTLSRLLIICIGCI